MSRKILELFAGSRSIGRAAEALGFEVFSTDIKAFQDIDYVTDILEIDLSKIPFVPDCIWGSPLCTGFSIASIGKNWTGGKKAYIPKSKNAHLSIALSKKNIEIIEHFLKLNPNLIYFMENPRGMMRHMGYVKKFLERTGGQRHTIWYCKYGDDRGKPTDIFTNSKTWIPREVCKNYQYDKDGNVIDRHCHHQEARRGAKTGTQGRKNNHERSKIPWELCVTAMYSLLQEEHH